MPDICFLDKSALTPWRPLERPGATLDSALEAPRWAHRFSGENDIPRLAARLLWAVTRTHALTDGNKRASVCLADRFLAANDWRIEGDDDALYTLVNEAASGAIDFEATAVRLNGVVLRGAPTSPFEDRYPDVITRLAT